MQRIVGAKIVYYDCVSSQHIGSQKWRMTKRSVMVHLKVSAKNLACVIKQRLSHVTYSFWQCPTSVVYDMWNSAVTNNHFWNRSVASGLVWLADGPNLFAINFMHSTNACAYCVRLTTFVLRKLNKIESIHKFFFIQT
jgi:hypothetical protein